MKTILTKSVSLFFLLCIPFYLNAQEVSIIPQPKELKLLGKAPFRINTETRILVNGEASGNDLSIAGQLNTDIYKVTGYHLEISRTPVKEPVNCICLGEPGNYPGLKDLLDKYDIDFRAGNPGEQGYVIYSDEKVLLLAGSDPAGTFYALQSLLDIFKSNKGRSISVPNMVVRDFPSIKYRGLFNEDKWGPDRMTLDDYKDMIDYMASLKMNALSVGVYGCWGIQYRNELVEFFMLPVDKYPQLRTPKLIEYYSPKKADWQKVSYLPPIFEKDFFGELIRYGKSKHVTVYPSFNSLGHNTLLPRTFPEIGEIDEKGNPRDYGFCTTNEKTYKILFGIYDNIIDKYLKPNGIDWFDIQMDEVYQWDARDLKKFSEEEIYLNHMIKIAKYLKSKGINNIGVWTDMLEHRKLLTPQFQERIEKEGLKEVMRFQWWRYGGAYETTNPELGLRTWVFPMTGYTYPYHYYYPISRLDNVYRMMALGHQGKAEGASSYSIYDPAYHFEISALADFSWNPVDPDRTKAINDFTGRFTKDVFGERWKEAKLVMENLEQLYLNSDILGKLLYYNYSYVNQKPYKKHPYPEEAFNALKKISDARARLEKLGGIANNAADFLRTAMDYKDADRKVISQQYANIARMANLIDEFLLLYKVEDEYQSFKKMTDSETRLNTLGRIKNITKRIYEYQLNAISTWENIKPEFLHLHEIRNMSFMLKFCEENFIRIGKMEAGLKSNSLKEVPETLITGTYSEL
jgi:hypothetical protein